MSESMYAVMFDDNGVNYVVGAFWREDEAVSYMERLEEHNYEQQRENGELEADSDYVDRYRVEEVDEGLVTDDDYELLLKGFPVRMD